MMAVGVREVDTEHKTLILIGVSRNYGPDSSQARNWLKHLKPPSKLICLLYHGVPTQLIQNLNSKIKQCPKSFLALRNIFPPSVSHPPLLLHLIICRCETAAEHWAHFLTRAASEGSRNRLETAGLDPPLSSQPQRRCLLQCAVEFRLTPNALKKLSSPQLCHRIFPEHKASSEERQQRRRGAAHSAALLMRVKGWHRHLRQEQGTLFCSISPRLAPGF